MLSEFTYIWPVTQIITLRSAIWRMRQKDYMLQTCTSALSGGRLFNQNCLWRVGYIGWSNILKGHHAMVEHVLNAIINSYQINHYQQMFLNCQNGAQTGGINIWFPGTTIDFHQTPVKINRKNKVKTIIHPKAWIPSYWLILILISKYFHSWQ